MRLLYSCTLLIYILLSQLDIFTFVEAAVKPNTPLTQLITLDLDNKQSSSEVDYKENKRKGRALYTCKEGYLIQKLKSEGQVAWEAKNDEYINRVLIYPDSNNKPKAKVLYPDDPETSVDDGDDLESETDEALDSESESEKTAHITPEEAKKAKARAKRAAPVDATPPLPKAQPQVRHVPTHTVPQQKPKFPTQAAAHVPAHTQPHVQPKTPTFKQPSPLTQATGGKTLDIPIQTTSGEEQFVLKHTAPRRLTPETHTGTHVVHATSPHTVPSGSKPRKYDVYAEQSQQKSQRDQKLKQLEEMADKLTTQYNELTQQLQQKQVDLSHLDTSHLPSMTPDLHVYDVHRQTMVHEQPFKVEERREKLQQVTAVEEIHRTPKTKTTPHKEHLQVPEGRVLHSGWKSSDDTQEHTELSDNKYNLLSNKIEKVDFKVSLLIQEFRDFRGKFEFFAQNFKLPTTMTYELHDKHEKHLHDTLHEYTLQDKHEHVSSSDGEVSSFSMATQFPSGWHSAGLTTSTPSTQATTPSSTTGGSVTVDLFTLSGSENFDKKEDGNVTTFLFNKGKNVNEIKFDSKQVWKFDYLNYTKYPLAARYNKKTLTIILNFEKFVEIFEEDTNKKWNKTKKLEMTGTSIIARKDINTTDKYEVTKNEEEKIYTFTPKNNYGFNDVKVKKNTCYQGCCTHVTDLYKTENLLEFVTKVELREHDNNMIQVLIYLLDNSKKKFIKDLTLIDWKELKLDKDIPVTINVLSEKDTYLYTNKIDGSGRRIFKALDGYKINKVIAKSLAADKDICETNDEREYASIVEFNGLGPNRTVTLFYGTPPNYHKKIFEELNDKWQLKSTHT